MKIFFVVTQRLIRKRLELIRADALAELASLKGVMQNKKAAGRQQDINIVLEDKIRDLVPKETVDENLSQFVSLLTDCETQLKGLRTAANLPDGTFTRKLQKLISDVSVFKSRLTNETVFDVSSNKPGNQSNRSKSSSFSLLNFDYDETDPFSILATEMSYYIGQELFMSQGESWFSSGMSLFGGSSKAKVHSEKEEMVFTKLAALDFEIKGLDKEDEFYKDRLWNAVYKTVSDIGGGNIEVGSEHSFLKTVSLGIYGAGASVSTRPGIVGPGEGRLGERIEVVIDNLRNQYPEFQLRPDLLTKIETLSHRV